MTFAATVVSRVGIWQVSDHRQSLAGKPLPDPAMKQFVLKCDDGKALIAYAGIGVSPKFGVHVSDWLRKLLRGYKGLTIGVALQLIVEAATTKIAKYGKPLTFLIGASIAGRPVLYGITNRTLNVQRKCFETMSRFQLMHSELKAPNSIILVMEGSGSRALGKFYPAEFPNGKFFVCVREVDRTYRLIRKLWRKPNISLPVMSYLAYLNKLASIRLNSLPEYEDDAHTVSEECITTFLHPKTLATTSRRHGYEQTISTLVPTIEGSWDITQLARTIIPEAEKWALQASQHLQQGLPPREHFKLNELLAAQDWKPSDKF
jgi:hypothetical protein